MLSIAQGIAGLLRSSEDDSFIVSVARTHSDAELAASTVSPVDPKLEEIRETLRKLSGVKRPGREDLHTLQAAEADLCRFLPAVMLYPVAQAMKDKLYRLEKDEGRSWKEDLDRLATPSTIIDEPTLRLRLRQLMHRVAEKSAAFTRIERERGRVYILLTLCCLLLLIGYTLALWRSLAALESIQLSDDWRRAFMSVTPPVAFAGGIGATISVFRSLTREKARRGLKWVLIWQSLVRTVLGLIYAGVVVAALASGVLRLPIEKGSELPFLLVIGVAAGLSDALFGQAVSRFIKTGKSPAESKGKGSPTE